MSIIKVSFWEHVVGSCFSGLFSSLMFKVIIDVVGLISTIFLLLSIYFPCSSFIFLSSTLFQIFFFLELSVVISSSSEILSSTVSSLLMSLSVAFIPLYFLFSVFQNGSFSPLIARNMRFFFDSHCEGLVELLKENVQKSVGTPHRSS